MFLVIFFIWRKQTCCFSRPCTWHYFFPLPMSTTTECFQSHQNTGRWRAEAFSFAPSQVLSSCCCRLCYRFCWCNQVIISYLEILKMDRCRNRLTQSHWHKNTTQAWMGARSTPGIPLAQQTPVEAQRSAPWYQRWHLIIWAPPAPKSLPVTAHTNPSHRTLFLQGLLVTQSSVSLSE